MYLKRCLSSILSSDKSFVMVYECQSILHVLNVTLVFMLLDENIVARETLHMCYFPQLPFSTFQFGHCLKNENPKFLLEPWLQNATLVTWQPEKVGDTFWHKSWDYEAIIVQLLRVVKKCEARLPENMTDVKVNMLRSVRVTLAKCRRGNCQKVQRKRRHVELRKTSRANSQNIKVKTEIRMMLIDLKKLLVGFHGWNFNPWKSRVLNGCFQNVCQCKIKEGRARYVKPLSSLHQWISRGRRCTARICAAKWLRQDWPQGYRGISKLFLLLWGFASSSIALPGDLNPPFSCIFPPSLSPHFGIILKISHSVICSQ